MVRAECRRAARALDLDRAVAARAATARCSDLIAPPSMPRSQRAARRAGGDAEGVERSGAAALAATVAMRARPDRSLVAARACPASARSPPRAGFHLLGAPRRVRELAEAIARLQQDIVLCEPCFDLTDHRPARSAATRGATRASCAWSKSRRISPRSNAAAASAAATTCSAAPSRRSTASGPTSCASPSSRARVRAGRDRGGGARDQPERRGRRHRALPDRRRCARTGVRLSRIAFGMPLGGDLEYADHVTVGMSVENRRTSSDGRARSRSGGDAPRRHGRGRVAARRGPGVTCGQSKPL